jgi:hypothetical protein
VDFKEFDIVSERSSRESASAVTSLLKKWWVWLLIAGAAGILGGFGTLALLLNREGVEEDKSVEYAVSGGVGLFVSACVFVASKLLGAW